jgi:hypothetical protein
MISYLSFFFSTLFLDYIHRQNHHSRLDRASNSICLRGKKTSIQNRHTHIHAHTNDRERISLSLPDWTLYLWIKLFFFIYVSVGGSETIENAQYVNSRLQYWLWFLIIRYTLFSYEYNNNPFISSVDWFLFDYQ